MRLVLKFALVFLLSSYLFLAFFGYLAAHRHVQAIELEADQDLMALAGTLKSDIERRGDPAGTIDAARANERDIDVQYLPDQRIPVAEVSTVLQPDHTRTTTVRTPLSAGGVVQVSRVIPSERDLMLDELGDELSIALAMSVVLGVLGAGLGALLIGRPLERVVEQASRIGEGNLSQRLAEDGADEIGNLKRALNTMVDRLEAARKAAELANAERVQAHEQLRHMDRLRTVGTLASSIAHELGTPLNVVLIRGQSLASGSLGEQEVPAAGKTIVSQVDKMSRIVRQLLDFARAPSSRQVALDLAAVVESTKGLLTSLAKRQRVDCVTEPPDRPCIVVGDDGQLEQAISNLMMNAIQAMPEGGRLLARLRHEDQVPIPQTSRTMDAVCLDIEDDGLGIAPDALERIFDPFYTTKPKGEGTGLGLAVARGIAEDHGGFIRAKSELGKGSTFTLVLPRSKTDT